MVLLEAGRTVIIRVLVCVVLRDWILYGKRTRGSMNHLPSFGTGFSEPKTGTAVDTDGVHSNWFGCYYWLKHKGMSTSVRRGRTAGRTSLRRRGTRRGQTGSRKVG